MAFGSPVLDPAEADETLKGRGEGQKNLPGNGFIPIEPMLV
jgi:hypothetical protein